MKLSTLQNLLFRRQELQHFLPEKKSPWIHRIKCNDCSQINYIVQCCNHKLCPVCNYKVTLKNYILVSKFAELYYKEYNQVFLTLTYKNLPEFSVSGLQALLYQFRKKFLRAAIIKHILAAGLYAWDWTFTSNGFNIHIHSFCFLQKHLAVKNFQTRQAQRLFSFDLQTSHNELKSLQRGFIPQQIISKVWQQATQNSMVVDIRKVENAKSAMFEVMKYIQGIEKINQMDMIQRNQYLEVVKKIRRFSKFGLLYKKKLTKQKKCCSVCSSQQQTSEILSPEEVKRKSAIEIQSDDSKSAHRILSQLAIVDEWEQHEFQIRKQTNEQLLRQINYII